MKKRIPQLIVLLFLGPAAVSAAPLQVTFSSTVAHVEGTYVGALQPGHTITGTYTIDSDTANAGPGSDPNPSFEPGHEYSSFWEFPGPAYSMSLFVPDLNAGFTNEAPPAIVINNDLALTADDTGGFLPAGTYDWIELLGSTTSDFCAAPGSCMPADGEEWTLAIFSSDTGWLNADDEIPVALPPGYTSLLIGFEFDATGNETGLVVATVDSLGTTVVPLPPAIVFLLTGLGALGFLRRR